MGSPLDEKERSDNETQHRVTIGKAFYMGKFHVTVGQFREFVRASGYTTNAETGTEDFENGKKGGYVYVATNESKYGYNNSANWMNLGFKQGEDEPVGLVSWNDAVKFVEWPSKKSGRKVTLPSEAQWEYACRAKTTSPFNMGESISTDQANYDGTYIYGNGVKGENKKVTTKVGSFKPNTWGLYDMHGNAWQWCVDFPDPHYENLSTIDPFNPTYSNDRMLRGGSCGSHPKDCRSAYRRYGFAPGFRIYDIGFRVVVSQAL